MTTFSSLRILVVDDDETQAALMVIYLEQLGIKLHTTAADGEEAMKVLLESDDPYDVVFTDKDMPVLDGVGLVDEIRKHLSLTAVNLAMVTSNLTYLTNPPAAEVALRALLYERNVLPIPKDGLNKTVLKKALETMIDL